MPKLGQASPSDRLRIMGHMVKSKAPSSRGRLHLVIDEALAPLEALNAVNDATALMKFYARLQSLAELLDETDGTLLISSSPDSWSNQDGRPSMPKTTQDRFSQIRAEPLSVEQVQTFLLEGLKHTQGKSPTRASNELAQVILRREDLSTVRDLHGLLHQAWQKAAKESSEELGVQHLPPLP
jgi:hypothetical protein